MRRKIEAMMAIIVLAMMLPAMSQAMTLKVGDKAPDFTLPDQNGKPFSLSQFLGKKNVILAFYVLAFTSG